MQPWWLTIINQSFLNTTMRNISLFFTQEGRELNLQSAATTLAELQRESALSSETLSGKKLTVKETRNTLETKESVLPEGDFTLYVYPAKSKAGLTEDQEKQLLADVASIKRTLDEHFPQKPTAEEEFAIAERFKDPVIAQKKAEADQLLREMEGGSSDNGQGDFGSDFDDDDEDNY